MTISNPTLDQIPQLRRLWKVAFRDEDAFLDAFFSLAFSQDRCRCILENGTVQAVLYWFDATCENQKFAYLYAVATEPAARGRGLCRMLMEDTKNLLASRGYYGLILVPQKEPLRQMYAKMGYADCGGVSRFAAPAEDTPISIRRLTSEEYAAARRKLLPPGAVIQEGENLALLSSYAFFYQGQDFLAALTPDGDKLICHELLGNPDAAYALVSALGCREGSFCMPGRDMTFAQYLPLREDCVEPQYFGLAFD